MKRPLLTRMARSERAVTGYLHPEYAASLTELGLPRLLARSGGWILERSIPGSSVRDAMGCYPLFTCRDWKSLPADFESLEGELVSLSLVTDPFGRYDEGYLRECFPDRVLRFKEHFIVNLGEKIDTFVSSHHRRYARRALRRITVEACHDAPDLLEEWAALYGNLTRRHGISGPPAFSKASFARQLRVPGLVMFRAQHEGSTLGMCLWYVQGSVGYYHLGAYSDLGYELRASFGLFWRALEYFSDLGVHELDLGGGVGVDPDETGLVRFKRGWSTDTRMVYLCGRIFDHRLYESLADAVGVSRTSYFPAYRVDEYSQAG